MKQGQTYNNNSMSLLFLEKVNNYYIFYRLNDNTYVVTNFISHTYDIEENKIYEYSISWSSGHYFESLTSVNEFLKEN